MAKKRKTIMKEFRIDEISAVDLPAQEGARAVIMKRAAPKADDSKDPSSDDDEEMEDPEEEAGETPEEEKNEDLEEPKDKKDAKKYNDSHGDGGRFASGGGGAGSKNLHEMAADHHSKMAAEHQREMDKHSAKIAELHGKLEEFRGKGQDAKSNRIINQMGVHNEKYSQHSEAHRQHSDEARHQARLAVGYSKSDTEHGLEKSVDNDNLQQENDMNETELKKALEALQARYEELQAELDVAKSYGQMTDAQKAHFKTLGEGDDVAFLSKTHSERDSVIAKALEANPVVFTSVNGEAFRKNDDPRLIEMAKRADANEKLLKASAEREENSTFAKRASTELGKLPGDEATKVAVLKAIEGIKDETVRKNAVALLKAGNEAISGAFNARGSSQGVTGSATEQLENLAKSYSETNKVSIDKARVAVLSTPAGEALYTQTLAK